MKNKILFFTSNNSKIKEANKIIGDKIKVISLKNLPKTKEPIENGKTFVENAKIKSIFGFKKFQIPCFADDSGICIEALNNKPGIGSKRYLSKFKNNKEAFNFILSKTKLNTKACFVCSICLTLKLGHYLIFEGRVHGNIAAKPKGFNGFGYDPIFIPDGYKKTFAEMNSKEKNTISHRLVALRKMESFLFN